MCVLLKIYINKSCKEIHEKKLYKEWIDLQNCFILSPKMHTGIKQKVEMGYRGRKKEGLVDRKSKIARESE